MISYLLTVIMIQNVQAANKASQVFLPVLVLFYPFIDIVFAMARRFLRGKPVMSADKAHLHHFLMQVGISHEGCVKLVILFSAGLSIVAIFLIYDLVVYGLILLTLLLVLLAIFFIITGYFEPKLLNRYLQHRPILKTLNSYKNFTLTKIKYVSSADEMWQIILDVAKEYKFKGLIWKAGSGEKKMFGDTTEVPTFHKESMFFSGGEVLYKTDNELDEDVRSEIESVVKVIVIALDKRVKSLDN